MIRFRNAALFAVALVALSIAAGCGKNKPARKRPLEPNAAFSMNVIAVPDFWPREKFDWPKDEELRRIRKDAWARYGTPDFIRKVFTYDGRIIRAVELVEGHVMPGARPKPIDEWIYLRKDIRVRFENREVVEEPLTDEIETVCTYGDPVAIKEFDMGEFTQHSYYYYNLGKEFVFVSGRLVNTRTFSAAPGSETMRE